MCDMLKAFRVLGVTIVISALLITSVACKAAPTPAPTPTSTSTPGVSTEWFGTDSGVNEYDGSNWTTYNTSNSGLVDDAVTAIAIDNEGNKWLLSISEMGHFLNRTLWHNQAALTSSLGIWL